jgi:hypothetical protein
MPKSMAWLVPSSPPRARVEWRVVVFEKFSGLDLIEFLNFKDAYERHQLGFGYFLFIFSKRKIILLGKKITWIEQ